MKRFHTPSLLLGFGMGLLATALLGIVLLPFVASDLTDEVIMERAYILGMRLPAEDDRLTRLSDGRVAVTVGEGETLSLLAERLSAAEVLSLPLEFEILARQSQLPDPPLPGRYVLSLPCTAKALVRALENGPESW